MTYEGLLRVNGADTLAALLENGIGPAKSFGCGLLLVRRA
ncbi:MAG: type I-E CRISPR-associated protein Cas6/Cse3/CasE [Nitrospirota bacterium]